MSKTTVLLVEDNPNLNEINRRALEAEGYEVLAALSIKQAREFLRPEHSRAKPEIILLEVMLPDGCGLEFCREIRHSTDAYIIFLTSRTLPADRIHGLDMGGDDYITKPYRLDEMLARVRAALRRKSMSMNTITKGRLKLNMVSRRATVGGYDLALQDIEFSLLLLFAQNEDVPMDTDHLYEQAWGQPLSGSKSSLQKAVSRLRKKVENTGYMIQSVYGKSQYVFEEG